MNVQIFKVLFLLLSLSANAQDSTKNQNSFFLSLPRGWYVSVPKGFEREDLLGVDSNVGNIYSLKDSLAIQFDIGIGMDLNFEEVDCSLKNLLRKAKEDLQRKGTKNTYKIPQVNNGYVDTINGRAATFIMQNRSNEGMTSVYIKDCKTDEWIGLLVRDLNLEKLNVVLKIFKSINR